MIYRAICEHLEVVDRVMDAVECWQLIVGQLTGNTDIHDEQEIWILGQGVTIAIHAAFI